MPARFGFVTVARICRFPPRPPRPQSSACRRAELPYHGWGPRWADRVPDLSGTVSPGLCETGDDIDGTDTSIEAILLEGDGSSAGLARLAAAGGRSRREAGTAQHPVLHRRRCLVGAHGGLRLLVGEDAGLRPRGPRGDALHPRLHAQRQVRTVACLHPHRAQFLATRGGGQSLVLFPGQVQDLRRGAGRARLSRGLHGQGLGAGRGRRDRRQAAAIGGPAVSNPQADAPPPRGSATTITPPTSPTSWPPGRRTRRSASGTGASSRIGRTNSIRAARRGASNSTRSTACPRCVARQRNRAHGPARLRLRDRALRHATCGACWPQLQERGLLDNTLVVVTADNGMPFPHVKGQAYEYSNHLPLADDVEAGHPQSGPQGGRFRQLHRLGPDVPGTGRRRAASRPACSRSRAAA